MQHPGIAPQISFGLLLRIRIVAAVRIDVHNVLVAPDESLVVHLVLQPRVLANHQVLVSVHEQKLCQVALRS